MFVPIASAIFSFILVAFGQPAWVSWLGIFASLIGYVGIFWALLQIPSKKYRFWMGLIWFAAVEAVHLSWLLTHPYSYIYGIYLFLIFAEGAQFGLLALFINRTRLSSIFGILGLSGFWVLMEWIRLFFFSGFPFNPIGLAMTSSLFGLQPASLFGIYGLSFFIMAINLWLTRLIIFREKALSYAVWALVAAAPFLFGAYQIRVHENQIQKALEEPATTLDTVLVQTAFPIEETIPFESFDQLVLFVQEEWRQILKILAPYQNEKVEMIALPEYVVPFGTYVALFDGEAIEKMFLHYFPEKGKDALPPLKEPLALKVGEKWHVTNAYICQALSNLFHADLVAGLQDDQWVDENDKQSFSSGFYFWPKGDLPFRYEKQILLPMAEYIPFDVVKKWAKNYGISGSFTKGTGAKVFPGCKAAFGISICYEEAYGNLMKENRALGANLLINLTSDVWYPNSRLPKQHFDHARLRSVEMGIPLIRACNTGITAAFDSLGRVIAATDESEEWTPQALVAKVPLYHYKTFYTLWGDLPIILGSLLFFLISFWKK